MIRRDGRRLGALFLLTAFLAGGFGLSDLDAFLFHSHPHGIRADAAHLEQPGGCGAHSERCVLAVATARTAAAGSTPVKLRVSSLVFAPLASATSVHRSIDRASLQDSRAPPRASTR
jgi:hypothetical protein